MPNSVEHKVIASILIKLDHFSLPVQHHPQIIARLLRNLNILQRILSDLGSVLSEDGVLKIEDSF